VIVGGMSFGTLLTLFVVPTAYTLLAGRQRVASAAGGTPGALPARALQPGHAD
jgi:multidrug efflux pump